MNEEPILQPNEAPTEKESGGVASFLFDILEMFAWSLFVVFILFTFTVRLCRVEGPSMENTLFQDQHLLVQSIGYTPTQDDIIVFHMTEPDAGLEKTLVKRVIATGGQELFIDFNKKEIYVNGKLYEDAHAVLKYPSDAYDRTNMKNEYYDPITNTMSLTVPENAVFVLGDNRNDSKDSRDGDIMFVDADCVLGKVILRISPFTLFP